MQRQTTRPASAQPVNVKNQAQASRPVPLDPKQLQAVAGGLPKGGWVTPNASW